MDAVLNTTLGIDEAGRGPVLGPMVLCGVCLRPGKSAALTRAGVADSKAYGASPQARTARAALAKLVVAAAESVVVRTVDVAVIDERVRRNELNMLEREVACDIIEHSAPARRIIADGVRLFAPLVARFPSLIVRNRAEDFHVAVAAASIVAKVRRDELFDCIARRYQPAFGVITGGGYCNAATRRFLDQYFARYGYLPPETRRSFRLSRFLPKLPGAYDPFCDVEAPGQMSLLPPC